MKFWDALKAVVRGKYIAISSTYKKVKYQLRRFNEPNKILEEKYKNNIITKI